MLRICGLLLVFFGASLVLYAVWSYGPLPEGAQRPRFPRDLEGLRELSSSLTKYEESHAAYTVLLFSAAYLYKQTFAIPGSFFMNLLAGALFGTVRGVALVCSLNAVGASLCFCLSALFAAPIVDRFLKSRIESLRCLVNAERDRLWFFLLSARIFPFTPHWLLNISSPFLDVPLRYHASSVFVGLFPYNLLCVRAGTVLAEVNSMSDVFDVWTLSELFSVSLLLLVATRIAKQNSLEKKVSGYNDELHGVKVS
ncbi:VTT domain-containing protein [Caenorhabditis elegans]|uniref:VTT domain-containing protein n=1 Tax=Caenorhabditis elegans TaxID=6239 RepID=Q9XXB4_CAEEL|nr:Transmembrane protein 41A [Caenorhabditis elegans]CAA19559.3 Transmembrane protein 41A [Caenorhabditis elegans]|eukprot:NP_493447.2 Uncharacterized protein CELE_Y71A12C.2 [Caenorhabditis elegans]